MSEWETIDSLSRNQILRGNDFYISYMPPGACLGLSLFASDEGRDETAVVVSGDFFILNGDHRKEYEGLVSEGLAACKAYFEQHKTEASSWSD